MKQTTQDMVHPHVFMHLAAELRIHSAATNIKLFAPNCKLSEPRVASRGTFCSNVQRRPFSICGCWIPHENNGQPHTGFPLCKTTGSWILTSKPDASSNGRCAPACWDPPPDPTRQVFGVPEGKLSLQRGGGGALCDSRGFPWRRIGKACMTKGRLMLFSWGGGLPLQHLLAVLLGLTDSRTG